LTPAALRRFALRSTAGLEATILCHGATLMRLRVPDARGRLGDVVLGFDDPRAYLGPHPHLGGIVGRYANRIAAARFALGGRVFPLTANDGPHTLHGGNRGFDKVTWDGEPLGDAAVELRNRSADGDEGFPGNLDARVTYRLEGAALRIECSATTDAPTVVSLASHAYWNLEDGGASAILDHTLWIAASRYTPIDASGIPTGRIEPVAGTPFDFTTPQPIGARIETLIAERGGYDHNFALDRAGDLTHPAARLVAARSGCAMTLHTTLPGLQLYSGSCFDGVQRFRDGIATPRFGALALEAQHFPNAPNEAGFPSPQLLPGDVYAHTTVYAFDRA
jgi:aldose 1-epimerase